MTGTDMPDEVALDRPSWRLGVVQSMIRPVESPAEMQPNLRHMLHLIDNAFHYGFGPDLLFFHEFPLSGWDTWNRQELLERCIEVPGNETAAIADKARQYNCYIAFGAYVHDPDWPGHVLSNAILINNRGEIERQFWKARNVKGVFPGFELFTTTIYDVLDEYVERYGEEAVLPIARTPLGNLAFSSTQLEPEMFRVLALKGAEVILRTASGGFMELDIRATALFNHVYCAVANNALLHKDGPYFEDTRAGGSAIYGPDGEAVAMAPSKHECLVEAQIPIAEFRQRRRRPDIHMDLCLPTFQDYVSRFPPNLFSKYLPTDLQDADVYLRDKDRWS